MTNVGGFSNVQYTLQFRIALFALPEQMMWGHAGSGVAAQTPLRHRALRTFQDATIPCPGAILAPRSPVRFAADELGFSYLSKAVEECEAIRSPLEVKRRETLPEVIFLCFGLATAVPTVFGAGRFSVRLF
jgi:hypothetical protein